MSGELKYQLKQSVLCYHGPLLYEAKIIEIDHSRNPTIYRIHYKGWKDRWDEWVAVESIVELNQAGLSLQAELRSKNPNEGIVELENEKLGDSEDKEASASEGSEDEAFVGPLKHAKNSFLLPEAVQILNLDWKLVNNDAHLPILPASPSVTDAINDFIQKYRKKKMVGLGVFDQFVSGLIRLFETYIGRGLLYPFERIQFLDVTAQDEELRFSYIYGPIHLLRMLSKYPSISRTLTHVAKVPIMMDSLEFGRQNAHLTMTTRKIIDMLQKFMIDEAEKYFGKDQYIPANDDYLKRLEQLRR